MKILGALATFIGFIVLFSFTHGFAFWAGKKSREISDLWYGKRSRIKDAIFGSEN